MQMNDYKKEVEEYYSAARLEFDKGHYHLVISNLNCSLYLMENKAIEDEIIYKKIYKLLCRTYMTLKQWEKAEEICDKAVFFSDRFDRAFLSYFYTSYFYINLRRKMYYKAVFWFKKTMNLLDANLTIEEARNKIRTINYYARYCLDQNNLKEAKKCYIDAFKLTGKYNLHSFRGDIFLGLGYFFHIQNNLNFAERCYLLALKYVSPEKNPLAYGRLMHNLGEVYESYGLIHKARETFLISINNADFQKLDKRRVAFSIRGLASTYKDSNLSLMYDYCMQALNLMLEDMGVKFEASSELELGHLFSLLSYWMKKNQKYQDSKLYYQQAKSIFEKYNCVIALQELENRI